MTFMRMLRRDPRTTMWLSIALVLLVALAGTTIGLAAESTGLNAASKAKSVAGDNKIELACINQVLGTRTKPTHDEDVALQAYSAANAAQAKAAARYATANAALQAAELGVLQAPTPSQARLYLVFLADLKVVNARAAELQSASAVYERAADTFQAAIQKVIDLRAKSPLGQCKLGSNGKEPKPVTSPSKTPSLSPSGTRTS